MRTPETGLPSFLQWAWPAFLAWKEAFVELARCQQGVFCRFSLLYTRESEASSSAFGFSQIILQDLFPKCHCWVQRENIFVDHNHQADTEEPPPTLKALFFGSPCTPLQKTCGGKRIGMSHAHQHLRIRERSAPCWQRLPMCSPISLTFLIYQTWSVK